MKLRTRDALASISVVATNYPAFSSLVAPVILANYANLTNFNLLPNAMAMEAGLVVTSSDTNIISVSPQNLLTTYRPGTVTLSATYQGKNSSAVVRVKNQAVLVHRYTFTNDANDSVGAANGTLVGTANISGGQVQLDGGSGDYVALPGGLLSTFDAATMDIWATISSGQQHWSRLWEFADPNQPSGSGANNELYFAPAWNPGANAVFFSYSAPYGGINIGPTTSPMIGVTVHLTCVLGDGSIDLYTNAVPFSSGNGYVAPVSQAGTGGSWIGYSPYGDPGIDGSVQEYRIYQGRLSDEEIEASDALGALTPLSTTNASLSASASSGSIVLAWPLANAGFAVESSPTLGPKAVWTTLTNGPALAGTNWQLTIPASSSSQFYRLIR